MIKQAKIHEQKKTNDKKGKTKRNERYYCEEDGRRRQCMRWKSVKALPKIMMYKIEERIKQSCNGVTFSQPVSPVTIAVSAGKKWRSGV